MRGGKRANAGRKKGRTLSIAQRMKIGTQCERLWRETYKEAGERELEKKTVNVRKEHAKVQSIPITERNAWHRSEEAKEYLEDVEYALREDQGIDAQDDSKPARITTVTAKRPKNRQQIIKQITSKMDVSPRMVETCWKEFRRMQAQIRDDLQTYIPEENNARPKK